MKARYLKHLLNDTGYIVHWSESRGKKGVCIGSPLCHDLLFVDAETLNLRYALDSFHEGRKSVAGRSNSELEFIWDKLAELIMSGKIKEIIREDDKLDNPIPVYYEKDGHILTAFTDKPGYPNVTSSGILMYENTHFVKIEDAVKHGIAEVAAGVEIYGCRLSEIHNELREFTGKHREAQEQLQGLVKFEKELREKNNG